MQMIRKLGEDKKANWPGHLAEIMHAYNATQSTVMGYSPHNLMFGCRPRLLVNFYFPTSRGIEVPMRGASTKHVDEYIITVCDWLKATLWEDQAQSKVRSPMTEMVLRLKDRHCGSEAWQSGLSES